jgi:Tol biopolymer transport system component
MRVLLGLAALAAFLAMPAAAAAPSGRIVFFREVGEQAELFSIRPDRSGLRRLTHEPAYDRAPTWSPDGRRIASFGEGGIVIRGLDGSVLQRIAIPVQGSLEELEWSPDGHWLSYLVEHCSYEDPRGYVVPPCADLWVVRPDGTDNRRLLDRAVALLDGGRSYAWSPAGRRLVYEGLSSGPSFLGVVDLGSGRRARIPGTAGSADPSWSRAATIAFVRGRGVLVVRPDGRGLKRLARGSSPSRPTWSPGGRRLAYLAAERAPNGNRWGVWVVRRDGSKRRRVGVATDDRELLWSSDGTRLLWENAGQRLIVARSDRSRTARFLTRGADPDWG